MVPKERAVDAHAFYSIREAIQIERVQPLVNRFTRAFTRAFITHKMNPLRGFIKVDI